MDTEQRKRIAAVAVVEYKARLLAALEIVKADYQSRKQSKWREWKHGAMQIEMAMAIVEGKPMPYELQNVNADNDLLIPPKRRPRLEPLVVEWDEHAADKIAEWWKQAKETEE